jgi:methylmalonyl-CoA mutase N-terminal domain/subunit
MGGMVPAIERGFPQREIQEAAFQFQRAVERKEKIIVGVNEYVMDEKPMSILYIDETVAEEQLAGLQALRASRDNDKVRVALGRLQEVARGRADPILEAARACRHLASATPRARSGASTWSRRPLMAETQPGAPGAHRRRASTGTTAAPRSWPAPCATRAWRSSTPASARARK